MYLLYTVLFFSILYYFWSAIKHAVMFYSNSNNLHLKIGNPWFYALVFTNVLILWFVCSFYQQKKGVNSAGTIGPIGYNGIPGEAGPPCKICLNK